MKKLLCFILAVLCFLSPALAELEIRFLDVGQADAAIILCDGEVMMIDGGNVGDSRFIYSYLRNTLALEYVDVVIATHPHEDHIGGIPAALNAVRVGTIYSPVDTFDSEVFTDLTRYAACGLTVPQVGDSFQLGGATVRIIGICEDENINDLSIVVRIDYMRTSFLFTGDATSCAEAEMLASGIDPDCDVLKVGHHGSSSSSSAEFLEAVSPAYAVISVGAGNRYGHPKQEVLDRLTDAGAAIYRTDQCGEIICRSDGRTISFEFEKPGTAETLSPDTAGAVALSGEPAAHAFVGNARSRKLHLANCGSVCDMDPKNMVHFDRCADAFEQGYEPCGRCAPSDAVGEL